MAADGVQRPQVVLRAKALAEGYTDGEIRRQIARGRWTKAVRGAYVVAPGSADGSSVSMSAVQRHLVAMHAARSRTSGQLVFSHLSAALVHQLPVPVTATGPVHVTRNPPAKAHRGPLTHAHATTLAEDDIVERNGWLVTSVDRTVADLTRVLPFEDGVVVADAALHRQLTTKERLTEQLKTSQRLPGGLAASRAIGFADGRSESVGESRKSSDDPSSRIAHT